MRRNVLLLAACGGLGAGVAVLVRRDPTPPPAPPPAAGRANTPASASTSPPTRKLTRRLAARRGGPEAPADTIVDSDPTSKTYDPITLTRISHVTPIEIFQKEPRDEAFAGPRERALEARLAARLRRRIAFDAKVEVSCRTSSCELTVVGARDVDDMNAALDALDLSRLTGGAQLGRVRGPDGAATTGMDIILLYSADERDHARYDRTLKQHEANDEPPAKAP